MLAGYLPYADTIEDSDVIIISKDGVHLYQASAAGIGGGLRYWVETEDEIYRVADITALSALTYDPTQPVYKYTWHGAPMTETQIGKAVYTALDSTGKQPDWIFPLNDDVLDQTRGPLHYASTGVRVAVSSTTTGTMSMDSYDATSTFHYSKDFGKIYVGWDYIDVDSWFVDNIIQNSHTLITDLNYEHQSWYSTTPQAIVSLVSPGQTKEYNGHDLYVDLKNAVNQEYNSNPELYSLSDNPVAQQKAQKFIDTMNGVDDEHPSGQEPDYDYEQHGTKSSDLLDDIMGLSGQGKDPLDDTPSTYHNEDPGLVMHNVYDRRIGHFAKIEESLATAAARNAAYDSAIKAWTQAYDPNDNPEPGGFDTAEAYAQYMVWLTVRSGGGGGKWAEDDTEHSLIGETDRPSTLSLPCVVVMSCVGYYPDYEPSHIYHADDDPEQELHFPTTKPQLAHSTNFPGIARPSGLETVYTREAVGASANFGNDNNAWSPAPGTSIQRLLRGLNTCVDYKDSNGFVWEVGFFVVSDSKLIYNESGKLVISSGTVQINDTDIGEVIRITDSNGDSPCLSHWSFDGSWKSYIEEAFVINQASDGSSVNIYKYSVQSSGAGEQWLNNARNLARKVVDWVDLKTYKAYEGSQITVRTNIGVNTNEGFKTGLEVVDFDDVKKFEETSYIDPVTGSAMFKGTVTSDGGLVQKRLKAGTGITITRGEKEDTISSTGGGGSVDVDTVLALMEKGPGITPIKDILNNKIRIDLKHDVNVKNTSTNYISIERSYKEDPEEPGTLTNEYVDEVDLKMTAIRNDIYNASHMVKGNGGIDLTPNTGTGQVTISTDTISNITVNGEPTSKSYDSETGKYNVDLQISSGGDDYDIPLPIPDYVNRVFLSDSVWYTPQTYTAPSDGVLFLEASYSDTVSLPVTIDSFTWKLGRKASGVGSRHDSHNMIFVKEGTVITFGTRVPSSGWASNASTSGIKLWFIPFETMNASEFDGDTVPYILPYPDYSTRAAQISASSVPTIYDDPSWYTYTSTVDGIMVANPRSTTSNYIVSPLDDNDNVVGTYLIASSTGESQRENDYLPIRKGKKYKIQKTGSPFDINIFAYKTTSDISELYSPYLDFGNPITKTITTSSGSTTYYDIWGTGEGDFPALLLNNLVEPASLPLANLRIKTSGGALDEIKLTFSSSNNNNPSWPLMPSSLYSSKYQVLNDYYDSGDLKILKYQKFEPPVAPKRILYNGQNLVDSNGDVDLTFLKQLIDDLDARITALGG